MTITEKSKFSFYLIIYTPMRASDRQTKHERHGIDVSALNI